jgi:hypothetical protein
MTSLSFQVLRIYRTQDASPEKPNNLKWVGQLQLIANIQIHQQLNHRTKQDQLTILNSNNGAPKQSKDEYYLYCGPLQELGSIWLVWVPSGINEEKIPSF